MCVTVAAAVVIAHPPLFIQLAFGASATFKPPSAKTLPHGPALSQCDDHAELIGPTRNHLSRHTPDSRWLWAIIAPAGAFDKINRAPRAQQTANNGSKG